MKKRILIAISAVLVGLSSFGQLDRSIPPKPQPNPEIKINIPDVITTENGMKVIIVENHKLPKVSFQLFVDYPIIPEGDKAGIGDIFGQLMGSGTEKTPKDDFDAQVDYMGASVFTTSRGFFASSLKKHTPKLLTLLSEVVMQPAFPEDEFDRLISQNISALASEKTDPNAMAGNVASVVKYGKNHPYGEITTEETLGNITLEDIKAHYKKYFVPNHAYMVIVGDVTQEEAKGYVEKYFGAWQKGETMTQAAFDYPKYNGNNVYFVDKPGAVQSQISITHTVELAPGHEDVVKVRVLNQILGGGSFSARLMSNLREDKAYTYGCYSSMSSDELIGTFSAGGSFRNEVTDSAIVQIMYEIARIGKDLVTDKELSLVKSSMTGSFARSLESPQTMANFALNTVRYGLPKDYYATYLTRLEKVTKEDLLAMAKKYLRPENLSIIVVGNSEIAANLEQFDTNGGMEFRDSYGDEAIQLKAVPEGVTVESVVNGHIFKTFMVGSQDELDSRLAKVGFIQKTYKAFIEEMGAEMFMTSYQGKPNKTASIVSVNTPQGKMVAQKEWFNGEAGGNFIMGAGKTKFEGEELENRKESTFPMGQCYYFTNDKYKVELLGIDEVEGKEYYKVKVGREGEDDFGYEYYSTETGWLMMEETFATDEEGNSVSSIMNYSDFKEVKGGMVIAHTMIMNNSGQVIKLELDNAIVKKKAKTTAFDGEF
jgi:zinc protease